MVKNWWVVGLGWGSDRHKNEELFCLELSLVAEFWSCFPTQTDLQLYALQKILGDAQELKTRQYQNKLGKNDSSNIQDLEKLNLAAAGTRECDYWAKTGNSSKIIKLIPANNNKS